MKALISFLTFLICSLCCYSQSSVTGAQQKVAAQRESFSDIINVGDLMYISFSFNSELWAFFCVWYSLK